MYKNRIALASLAIAGSMICASEASAVTCTVPNTIANGQVADASKVMGNFDAVAQCAGAAVTPTGTPTTGSIAVVSGPTTITGGNLTGDVTTAGGTATTLSNSGVTAGSYTSANIIVDAKGRVTAASSGSGGGGAGGGSISALRDKLRLYSVEHRKTIDTNSFVEGVLNWGGLIGFVFEGMASSGDSSLYKGTTFTVPAGKHAIIVDHTSSYQSRNNGQYYGTYLYNDTTNYWIATSNAKSTGDGAQLADNNYWSGNAFSAQDSETTIATAGQVIAMRINNPSNDGIKRVNGGSFIIAIVDDVTNKVDPIVPN